MTEFVDVMIRAESREAFWAAAVETGLAVAEGRAAPGIDVAEVGRIVDTPPMLDGDGNIVDEPTFRPGWHVNVRVRLPDPGDDEGNVRARWAAIRDRWLSEGEPVADGVMLAGVTLITAEIATPAQVWA